MLLLDTSLLLLLLLLNVTAGTRHALCFWSHPIECTSLFQRAVCRLLPHHRFACNSMKSSSSLLIPILPALLLSLQLGCLDPVLTIAAAMANGKPIFLTPPPDQQADVAAARAPLLAPAVAARSDHVAVVAAYNGWAKALSKGGVEAVLCCWFLWPEAACITLHLLE